MIVVDKPPGEIQTLIDNHINGFNTQDNELFLSVFGEIAIIIDDGVYGPDSGGGVMSGGGSFSPPRV